MNFYMSVFSYLFFTSNIYIMLILYRSLSGRGGVSGGHGALHGDQLRILRTVQEHRRGTHGKD